MASLPCRGVLLDRDGVLVDSTAAVERWVDPDRRPVTRNAIPDSGTLKRASIGAASFDSARGAGIRHECRQIIQFGKDGSYSKGLSNSLYVHTIVSRQHKDLQFRPDCSQLLSQFKSAGVWQ